MAYAALDSPLPGLTVTENGCRSCGMRGSPRAFPTSGRNFFPRFLGQDDGDDTIDIGDDPDLPITPDDLGVSLSTPIMPASSYPATIGSEFTSNGDGTYTNIQTGQSVPMATAQAVTAATTGSATANLSTVNTEGKLTLTDPTTNTTSTVAVSDLSVAAQALQAAGQLVTASGVLTAQGQALSKAGALYTVPPSTASSLSTWASEETMVAGVPNAVVLIGGLGLLLLVSKMGGRK